MLCKVTLQFLLSAVFINSMHCPTLYSTPRPLTRIELIALVAGDVAPENIIIEIQSDGLAFLPDDEFRALLKNAGADRRILDALTTANAVSSSSEDTPTWKQLFSQLSHAGSQIKAEQWTAAAQTL